LKDSPISTLWTTLHSLYYIFIFIMKSCTKHTKKKTKYNRLDNHAGLQVSAIESSWEGMIELTSKVEEKEAKVGLGVNAD